MALSDSIEEFRFKKLDGLCPFGKLVESLNDNDKKVIDNAINKNIPSVTLANALRKEGYKIAEATISQHRRNICRCIGSK